MPLYLHYPTSSNEVSGGIFSTFCTSKERWSVRKADNVTQYNNLVIKPHIQYNNQPYNIYDMFDAGMFTSILPNFFLLVI